MNKGNDMKQFTFYTYRTSDGGDQTIVIEAANFIEAVCEFDRILCGEHTPVDTIVENDLA
jgi:hypothetical protein